MASGLFPALRPSSYSTSGLPPLIPQPSAQNFLHSLARRLSALQGSSPMILDPSGILCLKMAGFIIKGIDAALAFFSTSFRVPFVYVISLDNAAVLNSHMIVVDFVPRYMLCFACFSLTQKPTRSCPSPFPLSWYRSWKQFSQPNPSIADR